MGWNIENGPEIGDWTAKRVDGVYFREGSEAIGLRRDGKIVAGVIYESFNKASIVCHIAIEGRINAEYLAAIFDYPFNVCGVNKIIVTVAGSNNRSLGLVKNMGFEEAAKIGSAHPTGDLVILTIPRDRCRFLGEKYGQKLAITTSRA